MRSWLRLTMLVWVTTVLVVSPVLAALTCRACCAAQTERAEASCTESCCAQHRSPASQTVPPGRGCHECPQCERSRTVPVTPVPPSPVFPDGNAVWAMVATIDVVPPLADRIVAAEATRGIVPHPRVNIVLCRWLT